MSVLLEKWSFDLCHSSDLSLIAPVKDVVGDRTLSLFYNKPGSFSVTTPIDCAVAMAVSKLSTCIVARVKWFDGTTEVGRKTAWSGPVFTIADNVPEDTTTITALGWLEELEHRFLAARVFYNAQVGGAIGQDLITKANALSDSNGGVRPTHLAYETNTDTQVRTRTYEIGQNIGAAMRELSEVENGYDIIVDNERRAVTFRDPTGFTVRPKALFGYRRPPYNLASVGRVEDGGKKANSILVQGANGIPFVADDTDDMDQIGIMMQDYKTISDTSGPDILGAYANAELVYNAALVNTLTLKPVDPMPSVQVPRLFVDFDLGDQVYASVNRGRLVLEKQACRVFGITMNFDREGNPLIQSFDINYS